VVRRDENLHVKKKPTKTPAFSEGKKWGGDNGEEKGIVVALLETTTRGEGGKMEGTSVKLKKIHSNNHEKHVPVVRRLDEKSRQLST